MPQAFLPWRGQLDPNRRVFAVLVLVSLLAHVPFTPLGALLGLIAPRRGDAEGQAPDLGQIHAIPVDLLEQSPPAELKAARVEAEAAPAAVPARKSKPKPRPTQVDAGVPSDAAAPDAGDAGPATDAGPDASPEAGPAEPVALSGAAGEMADANANVRILVYTDTIRGQPLGARVGRLLASVPQWRDFFGPGGLDPIRDFDRILIAGPQLRNSSEVLAVLQYNVDEARILDAVGDIVRKDAQGGSWLDAGVPAATAHADRAQRVFVVSPQSRLAIVTPPSAAADALRRARGHLGFPPAPGNEAVVAHVNTPWRMFIGLPVTVPKSLKSARMTLTPTARGGASVSLQITDSSAEQAQSDRDELYSTFRNNQFIPLLEFATGRLMVSLEARESEIRGTIELTPQQVSFVLDLVEGWFAERKRTTRPGRPGAAEPVPTAQPSAPDTSPPAAPAASDTAARPAASSVPPAPAPSGPSTPASTAPRP
ncbi:MAG: hypothetical protein JW940_00090 [Polyangiaceae bacterium]|nr:hypothetical protein [Polyangiaceae bacterium]